MVFHSQYLSNEQSFNACRKFWEQLLIQDFGRISDWRDDPSIHTTEMGGVHYSPVQMAKTLGGVTPIIFKISSSTLRAIKIVHLSGDKPYLEVRAETTLWREWDALHFLNVFARPGIAEVAIIQLLAEFWTRKDADMDMLEKVVDLLRRGVS